MADIIEMAREIGRQLQKDELYLKLELARQQSEEDEELQNAIGEFNLKRMAINNEASKADRSDEKMQQLNAEMRHAYAIIMSNENMIATMLKVRLTFLNVCGSLLEIGLSEEQKKMS